MGVRVRLTGVAVDVLERVGSRWVKGKPWLEPVEHGDVRIRVCKGEEELTAIDKVHEECFGFGFKKPRLRQLYRRFPNTFFCAECKGELVGYCLFKILPWPKGFKISRKARLVSFAVLPGYRKRGIGSFLLQTAIEVLSRYGVTKIYLYTEKDNLAAKKQYAKLGFVESGKLSGEMQRMELIVG